MSGVEVVIEDSGREDPVLSGHNLTKAYGWVRALEDVNIELRSGEVLAVVGDNGAGKSTLMKILAGAIQPDKGQLSVDGEAVSLRSPHFAQALGIAAVYQDLAVVNQRDIGANVFLGKEPCNRLGIVQRRRMLRETDSVFRELGIRMPPARTLVGNLSGGQRQAVAIGRVNAHGGRVVLLDEPTAALGIEQSELVLSLIRRLAARNVAVMAISHNLQHVLSVAHRVCVMRRGRVVGVRRAAETTANELVGLIVGRDEVARRMSAPSAER